ncbi:MAG: phosphatidate cytidylyltransferase [Bacteroidota bacterium]|nr:phosphatidate cytidylyltransferase [Odoribacter sp.]MDP3642669.1 phosphatidate cytidylyltransferase [Bacteroidota bacterium]
MGEGFKLILILIIYFALGAGLTYRNNKGKNSESTAQNWLKYLVYLGIIFALFAIIYYFNSWFKYACLWIILVGIFELTRLEIKNNRKRKALFSGILVVFLLISCLFYSFSLIERHILLITFFTVSAFDAFSQTIGQMFGKSKIVPQISPNKTVGGFIGGILLAVTTALLIGNILNLETALSLFWGICISLSAFVGDLAASAVKRKYQVKDFSRLIPGHGGYLDRFDSLMFAGAMVYLLNRLI